MLRKGSLSTPLSILLAVSVSCGLIYLLISRLDVSRAWSRVCGLDMRYVGASIGCAGVVLIFRSWRLATLTSQLWRGSGGRVIAAVAVHQFVLKIAPFRTGELVLPWLMKRFVGTDVTTTLANLLVIRVVELAAVCLTCVGAVSWRFGYSGIGHLWVTLPLLLVLGTMAMFFGPLVKWTGFGLAGVIEQFSPRIAAKIRELCTNLLRQLSLMTSRQWRGLWLLTCGVTVTQIAMLTMVLFALGIRISTIDATVGVTLALVSGALPIATVGNLGTHEAAWTAGFMWVGVPESDAIVSGVVSGFLAVGYALVFALPVGIWAVVPWSFRAGNGKRFGSYKAPSKGPSKAPSRE